MLAVHRGQKGRLMATGESVEEPDSKNYAELRPLQMLPICKYTSIEFFVSINLDLFYIVKMVKLNIIETFLTVLYVITCGKMGSKEKDTHKIGKED